MKFSITTWTLEQLYTTYNNGGIDLSPPYQRNFIWSLSDQQTLIDSIIKNIPIPTFFLLQVSKDKYQMVDGQQRSRTIISFINGGFSTEDGTFFTEKEFSSFYCFQIPVTIIVDPEDTAIEKFYALVNKTGIHLNKPEVRKADFYNTRMLDLIKSIANSSEFKKLKIFTEATLKRMNDIEFVAELVVLFKDGHVDKKGQLDDYFKKDITIEEANQTKSNITNILNKILVLNKIYPLQKTRYKQRNDFYTLFDFILNNNDLSLEALSYFYRVLVLIGSDIRPTQEDCEPLLEYARNCVTQSNSKAARESRLSFFEKLFLNSTNKANPTQKKILKYYKLPITATVQIDDYLTLNADAISKVKEVDV